MENRVVVLVDMDCFYCQVEEKLNPELAGKPIAVVQYNPWKGGGIIAVNYVARARGVTRHMRGDEAKEKCPEIELPSVPCHRGKADITKYRDAGKEVAKVLQKFTPLLERASIDEAYLDITSAVQERLKTLPTDGIATEMMPNTFALGYSSIEEFVSDVQTYGSENIDFDHENASMLLVGAVIVSEIRAAVYNETGYRCSAGIAHNKILAKLVCGMNKPNKQTVLPKHSVNILYKTLSLKKVKHLGGKFGDSVCEILRITKMGQLQTFTEKELQSRFDEKNGTWLYNIARGIDLEPVQAKFNAKSIGCCKQFKGKNALLHLESLTKWLKDLGDEIEDRLEKDALENNRTPKQMVVSFAMQLNDGRDTSSSRSYNFVADDELCGDMFSSKALELVMDTMEGVKPKQGEKNRKLQMPIKFLGISVGKFEDHSESKKTRKIIDFFSAGASKESTNDKAVKENLKQNYDNSVSKVSSDKEYILQKFFKVTEKVKVEKVQEPDCNTTEPIQLKTIELKPHEPVITHLDKQESFFARFLNKDQKGTEDEGRATTPVCKVVECGDNSNDTDYSSSTINNEINKSIALFEEDPQDIARVSDMRTLLNTTKLDENPSDDMSQDIILPANEEVKELTLPPEAVDKTRKSKSPSPNQMETFQCEECHKVVSLQALDTHADYHLALKLREEERQIFKQEREKRTQTKVVKKQESEDSKKELSNIKDLKKEQQSSAKEPKREVNNEANTSLANFLVKIDESKPTESCAECGKRISIEKFPEHMDFHEAQKLSRELNRKPVTNNFASNSVKRKRKSISPVKKLKMPCKTIDSFFK